MVDEKNHEGASSLDVKGNTFETPDMKIDVDPATLAVTFTDKNKGKVLSTISPIDMSQDYKFFKDR